MDGGRRCRENLWPLRVGVNHHKEVHSVLLCIIHVHTLPNSDRPLPWDQGCSSRLLPRQLTRCTILHDRLNCLAETGPPEVTPSQGFHTANPWLISMKVFKDPVLKYPGNNDSQPPENTVLLHRKFKAPFKIGVQGFLLYLARPTTFNQL